MMETKRKVLAYITKGNGQNRQLLVFDHKVEKEAGLQVPGGTIEDDELIIDALYREIYEETGIERDELQLVGKLEKTNYFPPNKDVVYERTIFHLQYIGKGEDEWEHRVEGEGEDQGLVFCFKFMPLQDLPELASHQDQAIALLDDLSAYQ